MQSYAIRKPVSTNPAVLWKSIGMHRCHENYFADNTAGKVLEKILSIIIFNIINNNLGGIYFNYCHSFRYYPPFLGLDIFRVILI